VRTCTEHNHIRPSTSHYVNIRKRARILAPRFIRMKVFWSRVASLQVTPPLRRCVGVSFFLVMGPTVGSSTGRHRKYHFVCHIPPPTGGTGESLTPQRGVLGGAVPPRKGEEDPKMQLIGSCHTSLGGELFWRLAVLTTQSTHLLGRCVCAVSAWMAVSSSSVWVLSVPVWHCVFGRGKLQVLASPSLRVPRAPS